MALCSAADDSDSPVWVIFTLRDDFLWRLARSDRVSEVLGRLTMLRSPEPEALAQTLERPLAALGYRFEDPGLPAEMVEVVGGVPGALPLLQFTAQAMWERRDRAQVLRGRSLIAGARAAFLGGDRLVARARLRSALEVSDSSGARALWQRLGESPLRWAMRLGSWPYAVAFAPDGRSVAAGAGDNAIYLIDTATREVRVLRGHRRAAGARPSRSKVSRPAHRCGSCLAPCPP